jgi:hypothetical protein
MSQVVSQLLAGTHSGPGRSPGAARVPGCEPDPQAPHLVPPHDASRKRPSSGRGGIKIREVLHAGIFSCAGDDLSHCPRGVCYERLARLRAPRRPPMSLPAQGLQFVEDRLRGHDKRLSLPGLTRQSSNPESRQAKERVCLYPFNCGPLSLLDARLRGHDKVWIAGSSPALTGYAFGQTHMPGGGVFGL